MFEGPLVHDGDSKKWCINDAEKGKCELRSGQIVHLRFGKVWLEGVNYPIAKARGLQ